MPAAPYSLVEICSPGDTLLLPWLDLYERSFPPDERVPASHILKVLHARACGNSLDQHILAAVPTPSSPIAEGWPPHDQRTDQPITALLFTYEPLSSPAAFLWYFAVQPGMRGQGLGSRLYRDVLARLGPQVRALIFDLEDPRHVETTEEKEMAHRRVMFYRRQGARVLGGIDYVQRCADYLPPLRLLLMVHAVQKISPQAAYDLAKAAMPEAVNQAGELRWADEGVPGSQP